MIAVMSPINSTDSTGRKCFQPMGRGFPDPSSTLEVTLDLRVSVIDPAPNVDSKKSTANVDFNRSTNPPSIKWRSLILIHYSIAHVCQKTFDTYVLVRKFAIIVPLHLELMRNTPMRGCESSSVAINIRPFGFGKFSPLAQTNDCSKL